MPNISLRQVTDSDLPIFYEQQRDPAAVHMAAFTAANPEDRAAFNDHWARILADDNNLIRTIVVEGQVAGSVSSYVDELGPEVTYWLGRDFWGRGIATAALAAFLKEQTTRPSSPAPRPITPPRCVCCKSAASSSPARSRVTPTPASRSSTSTSWN